MVYQQMLLLGSIFLPYVPDFLPLILGVKNLLQEGVWIKEIHIRGRSDTSTLVCYEKLKVVKNNSGGKVG